MQITSNDIGRIAITRNGRKVKLLTYVASELYSFSGDYLDTGRTDYWTPDGSYSVLISEKEEDLVAWDSASEHEVQLVAFKMYCDYMKNVMHKPTVLKTADEFMSSGTYDGTKGLYLSAARTALEGGMIPPKTPVDIIHEEISRMSTYEISEYIYNNFERKHS